MLFSFGFLEQLGSLPGQQPEKNVTVGGVRHGEGTGGEREFSDEGFIRRKTYPIIPIAARTGAIPYFGMGRIKDGAVGGIFFFLSVHPEPGRGMGYQQKKAVIAFRHIKYKVAGMPGIVSGKINVIHNASYSNRHLWRFVPLVGTCSGSFTSALSY